MRAGAVAEVKEAIVQHDRSLQEAVSGKEGGSCYTLYFPDSSVHNYLRILERILERPISGFCKLSFNALCAKIRKIAHAHTL